jgi:demethylmenaquinone methyltransferase / 2-methoxy-6-polyprenyl-1,4-benzoquinol methylase
MDILWRKQVINLLRPLNAKNILDVAAGTADISISAAKLDPDHIVGIDISEKMLELGRQKINKRNLNDIISLEYGEAEHLRFDSNSFDAVVTAFGVRNFEDLEQGLKEFYRVVKIGGSAIILEFSMPEKFPIVQIYKYYFRYMVPFLGGLISKNTSAYDYLPKTVANFPYGDDFCRLLISSGFTSYTYYPQTFGIAAIYVAKKESDIT